MLPEASRIEIQKDGDYIEKVVRDKYSVVIGNDFVTITGDVVVQIAGNAYVHVTGEANITSEKEISMIAPMIKLNANSFPEPDAENELNG